MNERKKKLLETMKKFNKDKKSEIFTMGSEIKDLGVNPTGIKWFDDFIGGGFKKGGHTILWGMFSVGKTALVLMAIAYSQMMGKLVCYVNTEKPIEPERFKFFGINLDELVYIEAPEKAEQALEAMRALCKDKVIDIFIIDSTNGLCPKSVAEDKNGKERSLEKKNVASLPLTLSNFYNVVNAHVFRSRASVVWIGQGRTKGIGSFFAHMGLTGGNAQEFYAYQIIAMRKGQGADAPVAKFKEYYIDPNGKLRFKTVNEPIGFDVVLKLTKTNSCKSKKENSEIHMPYIYEKGFVNEIVESDDIPIRIEASDDEERKMITEALKEKGIIEMPHAEVNEKLKELVKDVPLEETENDLEEKVEEKIKEEKPKRGRGRPKKSK